MLFVSGVFLMYTSVIVPVQICLWSFDDPCNKFPTLFFDVVVDTFFMVRGSGRIKHVSCVRGRIGGKRHIAQADSVWTAHKEGVPWW